MPKPTVDPRIATMRQRAQALRAELDRLDAVVADHEPGAFRDRMVDQLVAFRAALDEVDADIDAQAAAR